MPQLAPTNGLVGQLAARRLQVALPMYAFADRLINGLMGIDEWFGRPACGPLAASCPPYAFTDRLMALMVLIS